MEGVSSLHSCSELPPNGPVLDNETNKLSWILHRDANAVAFIESRFAATAAFAGRGKFGTVVALNDIQVGGRASLAVKILPFRVEDSILYEPRVIIRDVQQELFIACQVNQLHEETPVFIQTFGWLVSEKIPNDWKLFIDMSKLQYKDVRKLSYMFLFMEQSSYKFDSDAVAFDLKGYLTILYIILHALYVARQRFDFRHSDLHMGNIMIDIVHGTSLDLRITEHTNVHVNLINQYLPKIIDFGHARTSNAVDGGRNKNDVSTVFGAVQERAAKYDPEMDVSVISEFQDFDMPLGELLLNHPMFEKIRTINTSGGRGGVKRQKRVEQCSMCGSEATMRFETNNKYKFCHEYCAMKMKGLAFLL